MPTKEQEVLLAKHFGCVRYIYNHFLNERKEQYQANKKSDNYYAQAKTLTNLKKQEDTIWLREVNSQTLQFALRCLDTAYLNFFRGNGQFPRFKSKKAKNSFTVPQFGQIEDGRIKIPKFKKGITVIAHREVQGKIGKMTISKTPTGKYYVSIFTEQEIEQLPKTNKQVGIDLGLKDFVITSDNEKFKNNRYTKGYERQLAKAQKHLSRKQKGSNGFEKQRLKVTKIHEKISNSRLDTLHKVSTQLVKSNDLIVIEDLNVKGMIKNRKLSKHIADASWGSFVNLLEYKSVWYGRELVKINRFFPSSKTCYKCGWIKQDLKLSDREWTCKNGHHLDRDENAAKNILKEGVKIYGEGLAITKVEDDSDYLGSTSIETRSPDDQLSVGG